MAKYFWQNYAVADGIGQDESDGSTCTKLRIPPQIASYIRQIGYFRQSSESAAVPARGDLRPVRQFGIPFLA